MATAVTEAADVVKDFGALTAFVEDECDRRLRAYTAQPRDANEHFETEIEVLSGGYAYRQLFELVQNAADAISEGGEGSGRIHVRLERRRLVAANTGAALDRDGVVALLNARSSAKRAGQIGRFGIGFKSLLKLGGTVDLVSRSIGLRFDPDWCRGRIRTHLGLPADARAPGMRLAQVLDPSSDASPLGSFPWATTVVVASMEDPGVHDRLAEEMAAFPAEFVLFLESDVEVTLEVTGGHTRTITKRRDGDFYVVGDGTSEARWRLFQTRVRITDEAARSDALHLQARDEVPLAWAVPIGGREAAGQFWAFFPTQSATLAAGILNAPWKLNSDRTNVIPGPWNAALMREAAALIAGHLHELSTAADPGAPISALPRQLERQDELAAALVRPLWDMLVPRTFVADGSGGLATAASLLRHPIEDTEALRWWAGFADADLRRSVVHPSCQSGRRRASRLDALAREIAERKPQLGAPALRQLSEIEWLEAVASAEPSTVIPFLHFVDELVSARGLVSQHRAQQARIVPAHGGELVTSDRAILAPPARVPSGLVAVAPAVAEDSKARAFLVDVLGVREMSEDVWEEVLAESLAQASVSDDAGDWETFWANMSEAPEQVARNFIGSWNQDDLRFRNLDGQFRLRDRLVVLDASDRDGVPTGLILDDAFHAAHAARIPAPLMDRFPPNSCKAVGSWGGLNGAKADPFFAKVREIGWPKITGNPHWGKINIIGLDRIEMPSGWRLLPSLPPKLAAELTVRLVDGMERSPWGQLAKARGSESPFPTITFGHTTRRDAYDSFSAQHPLLFWIGRFGWLAIRGRLVPVKGVTREVVDALAIAGMPGAEQMRTFLAGFDAPAEIRVGRDTAPIAEEARPGFWSSVFEELERVRTRFPELRPVWELAAADGSAPPRVPTAEGPLPIAELFIASEEEAAAGTDDGRIVILADKAAAVWAEAGARPLRDHTVVTCEEQLGVPLLLRDIFPELGPVLTGRLAKRADAVWVNGLVARSGHRVSKPAVARDATGLLMIDRARFLALGWTERMGSLLEALSSFGLLSDDPADLLRRLVGSRVMEARAKVRAAPTLADRLLAAVGGGSAPLREVLPKPALEAAGGVISDERLAELALAVHGPTILTKVADALAAEGLDPPGRWGGEAARLFVAELGFPLEFATSAAVKREAELVVSGPIALPPLHDYQEGILAGLEDLLLSGEGRRRAVVSLPTGGGKTRVAAEAVVKLVLNGDGARTALWVAQTDELCEQAVQCFRQLWSNEGSPGEDLRVVRLWGGQANPSAPESGEAVVVIASIQTLNARLDVDALEWLSRPGVVVIDECHHAIAPSYSSLLRWLDVQTGSETDREVEPPVIGLSATPWRGRDDDESARLAARFDRRWLPADQERLHEELRRRRVLAELRYSPIHYDKPVHLSEAAIRHFEQYGELPEFVVEEIGSDPDRNELILDRVLASDASSILLFANSVAHAQYLAARLHLAGCPAAAVSGETDRLARQHFIRHFRSGEIRVMCNHSVLTTGFDAPKSDMILISRPVFSPVRYMQMVGRGLRGPANGGTDSCQVVTVEDNILSYRDRLAYHYCRRFFSDTA